MLDNRTTRVVAFYQTRQNVSSSNQKMSHITRNDTVLFVEQLCLSSFSLGSTQNVICLAVILVLTLVFLYEIYKQFSSVIRLHSTISSYCSDPRGFGNRFLLCITFLASYTLTNLVDDEYSLAKLTASQLEDKGKYILQTGVNMILPLVGVFYTRGNGLVQNTSFNIGLNLKMPIIISELLHVFSGQLWVGVLTLLNIEYGMKLVAEDHKFAYAYLICSVLTVVFEIIYILLQVVISINNSEHVDLDKYYCPDCSTTDHQPQIQVNSIEQKVLDNNTCTRCLRCDPKAAPTIDETFGKTELKTPIDFLVKEWKSNWLRSLFYSCFGNVQYPTYIQLHAMSFIFETIVFGSTAALALVGTLMRKQ
ncbi:unnamed protein product, partial [Didymodactylos carnosus]